MSNSSCGLNYHEQKIRRTLTHNIRKRWTAVSTLLGLLNMIPLLKKENVDQTVLFDQQIRPDQMLPLPARVKQGAMAIKSILHSSKLQHYWSFTISLLNAIFTALADKAVKIIRLRIY